jgi:metallo-beta-lactamase class B
MRRALLGAFAVALACGFACDPGERADGAPAAGQSSFIGRDLEAIVVAPGVWRHVSKDGRGIAANGLVIDGADGLLLVDTTWSAEQAEILLAWGRKKLGKRWSGAVLTHAHEDRSGGLAAVRRHGIPVGALDRTVEALASRGIDGVSALLRADDGVMLDPRGFEIFYPGPGHAADNVVVWLPGARVLFGGCLVKAADAADLGAVGDADLERWPEALRAVAERYPEAAIVVPGHGAAGDRAALDRTLDLLREGASEGGQAPG